MKKYKKMMQQKIASNAIMLCIGSAVFIIGQQGYLSKYKPDGNFGDFFSGFQIGLFLGFAILLIVSTTYIGTVLKDDKKLKEMYIKDTDERNIKISEMTGVKLQQSLCFPLLLATIVAGYFSIEVFFTLLAVVAFISAVTIVRKIYFNKTM